MRPCATTSTTPTGSQVYSEDAVWESPALGRFEGREAIRSFFRGASGIFSFAIHCSLNGHIEVEGDTASGNALVPAVRSGTPLGPWAILRRPHRIALGREL